MKILKLYDEAGKFTYIIMDNVRRIVHEGNQFIFVFDDKDRVIIDVKLEYINKISEAIELLLSDKRNMMDVYYMRYQNGQ